MIKRWYYESNDAKKLFFNHNEVDQADIFTRIEVGLDVKQFVTNNYLKEYIALKNTYLQNYLSAEYVFVVYFSLKLT